MDRRERHAQCSQSARTTANGGPDPKHNVEAAREEFYQRISKRDMAPLWKVHELGRHQGAGDALCAACVALRRCEIVVMESGGLITAEEALRRVLILENPALRGESRATNTLFAGIQMILPGEVAPAHRHVSSAIRFVLDGEGAYTASRARSRSCRRRLRHHGQLGAARPRQSVRKADVVARRSRLPAVNFYEASFADYFDENDKMQNTTRGDGDSLAFFGSGVLPDGAPIELKRSPVINYTYARTRPILDRLRKGRRRRQESWRARALCQSDQRRPVLPTMGANLALLPKGFKGEKYRSTRRHHLRSAPRAAAPPRSRTRRSSGAPTMSSWCRLGSATSHQTRRIPSCSRFPTSRRKWRSASGVRTRTRASRRLYLPDRAPGGLQPHFPEPFQTCRVLLTMVRQQHERRSGEDYHHVQILRRASHASFGQSVAFAQQGDAAAGKAYWDRGSPRATALPQLPRHKR